MRKCGFQLHASGTHNGGHEEEGRRPVEAEEGLGAGEEEGQGEEGQGQERGGEKDVGYNRRESCPFPVK